MNLKIEIKTKIVLDYILKLKWHSWNRKSIIAQLLKNEIYLSLIVAYYIIFW